MTIFASLAAAEQARQLANPEGQVGIQVAEWLNGNNRESNAQILALLNVQAGNVPRMASQQSDILFA